MNFFFIFSLHEEGSNNGSDDSNASNGEWQGNQASATGSSYCAKGHGSNDGTDIGLKKVCAHSGNIANVVANVVSNRCGVTRIIFRNACFYFSNQVSTNISGFGVNATTNTSEQRD